MTSIRVFLSYSQTPNACYLLFYVLRKLTLRQQQMDDRRRQNMNNEYGRGTGASGGDGAEEG